MWSASGPEAVSQIPEQCKLDDYYAYWHCLRAYLGVSLLVRKGLFDDSEPVFGHPALDMESSMVLVEVDKLGLASVYVPNGGKDYEAKLAS